MEKVIHGNVISSGSVKGRILKSTEPLSFWGGYNCATGEIIDRRHPLSGKFAKGQILAIPSSRGSTTTASVILESVKSGTSPAALIITRMDEFFSLASFVADKVFGKKIPVIMLKPEDFDQLESDQWLVINADGSIHIEVSTASESHELYQ